MARILTGIQSTGIPHLGNILGAILPGIELANTPGNEAFFFIADFHSLTTIRDAEVLEQNTYGTAAAWLACGFDTERGCFYRQSDIPEVAELTWYLSCFAKYSRLTLMHSFKDKSDRVEDVNGGLFFYPVLMAADILMYDANVVPIGKDQKQHLEFTRDLAENFNKTYGPLLVLPDPQIKEDVAVVPGIRKRVDENGKKVFEKMSKSYGNEINIFADDKALRKRIMSIETEPLEMGTPLPTENCIVFALYKLLSTPDQTEELAKLYASGSIGYGHAKQMLFEQICTRFKDAREKFNYFMANKHEIDARLQEGAEKAGVVAFDVLTRIRGKIGYKKYLYS